MKQKYYVDDNKNKIFEFDFIPKKPFTYKGEAEAALEDFDKNQRLSREGYFHPFILANELYKVILLTPCGERTFSVTKYAVPAYKAEETK